jgi:flagellar hook-associated protein 3 FlgL
LKGTESALNSIEIQIDRLLELGQQGMSDITGPEGRKAIAAEVEGIFTTILDVANTKEQGKYIFAGTATMESSLLPTPPLPPPPNDRLLPFTRSIGGADYRGNGGAIDLDISPIATVTTNLTGAWVFQGNGTANEDLFAAVRLLADGLQANNPADIKTAYDNIREIKNRVSVCTTTIGARQLSLENVGMNLGDFNETLQSIQNTYEAVDYPWAITQFAAEQSSQQAGLSILAKMGNYSLFDYIG